MGYRQTYGDAGLGSISGTVATLSGGGYTLGEVRYEGNTNIKYKLFYNAGNSQIGPGYAFKSTLAGTSPYSVTVTTVTETVTGAMGVVFNATAPTGHYFWGVVEGHPVKCVASNISLVTGVPVGLAGDGKFITTATSGNWVAINVGDAASATATTDATGSRFYVFFEKNSNTWLQTKP